MSINFRIDKFKFEFRFLKPRSERRKARETRSHIKRKREEAKTFDSKNAVV